MTTIAILVSGDSADPREGSGVPHGLASGLVACGLDVRRVNSAPRRSLDRQLRRVRWAHSEYALVQSALARRRFAAAGRIDAALQVGSAFRIDTAVPMATYDDMTVVQYERYRTGGFTRYPRRTLDAWRRRQRAVYQRANVCTVMSEWAKASIVDDYGLAPEKVFVVGAGINVTFAAVPNREWQRPRFLIVARDWRRKNVPQVVEALEFVRETWADATLDIVGPYPGPTPDGVVAHGLLNPADHDDRARIAALLICRSK